MALCVLLCALWRLDVRSLAAYVVRVGSWLAVTLLERSGPRDAPMARKELSSHTVFPNRVPLGRARTQLPLVGYSAPSFPRIVNSSGMIRTNKFASLKASCHALRQSTFASTLLFSRFAPRSSFLANSFHCGFCRSAMHSLLRLTRET